MSGPGTATYLRQTEAQWQKTVLDTAKTLGWSWYHTTFSIGSRSGFPDLVLFHPKHGTIYAELKSKAGKTTANQDYWLDLIAAAGERVFVWRPDDWPDVELILKGETLAPAPGTADWFVRQIEWRKDGTGIVTANDVKRLLASSLYGGRHFAMLPIGSGDPDNGD